MKSEGAPAQSQGSAAALRESFDRVFTRPSALELSDKLDFIRIGVGADSFVIRLAEVDALVTDKVVTPLPGAPSELAGVATFRSELVPVYDLRTLLGQPSREPARWLLIVAARERLALAFDRFEGHVGIGPADLVAEAQGAEPRAHVLEVARLPGGVRPVLHVPSIVSVIASRRPAGAPQRED